MGALGASGFIFRDFIKYVLPTITGACLLLPIFVPWQYIKIDQIVFLSFIAGYIVYPIIAQIANFVHDHLPCRGISLSEKSPAVKEGRWVKGNWDMKGLRSKIDKDEREYLYLTQSYLEYFQITAVYLLFFSLCNIINIIHHMPGFHYNATHPIKLFEYVQSISIGTIVGSPVPSLYAGFLGLIVSFFLFQASVIEYKALFGINGAYEFLLEKYQSIHGGLARNIWGIASFDMNVKAIDRKQKLKLELFRNNQSLETCFADDSGRFQFSNKFKECMNYRCKVVVVTPGFSGDSEIRISKNCIPCISILVTKSP